MIDRVMAIRSLGTKLAIGIALGASLTVAACGGGGSSSTSAGTTPTANLLTSCTATSADLTAGTGSTGTGGTADPTLAGKKLSVDGSSALQPLLAAAGKEFDSAQHTITSVAAGGSGKGLSDVSTGAVDIGMSDIFASERQGIDATALQDHQVAVVAFTLIVNNDLQGKVGNLTKAQIKQIYTGQVTNWSQLGGPSELITVVTRPTTSGTRATFKKYVLDGTDETAGTAVQDNTGAVLDGVKATAGAIGYVASGFVTGDRKGDATPLCIDSAKATAADINSGKYAFWSIEHAYTKGPAGAVAKPFLKYVLSDAFQKSDVPALNYFTLSSVSATAIQAHTVAGAPAPETLS